MTQLKFVLAALLVLVTFVPAFAGSSPIGCEEQTINTGGAPICNVGADPVDRTFKWVPPADWTLIKTDSPQLITQLAGDGREHTCVMPAGHIAANSPNGKQQVIVLCKNPVTKGWLTGTTMPRNPETIREAGERIAAGTNVPEGVGANMNTNIITVNVLPQSERRVASPNLDDDGFHWGTKSWIATGVVIGVATYLVLKEDKLRVDTEGDKVKCTATKDPNTCPKSGPGVGASSVASAQNFVNVGFNAKKKEFSVLFVLGNKNRNGQQNFAR
ncbi:MAG: hypothetical protein KBD17_00625 [Candidatus Pacebacteria bacterium]|nr:hypothetical protein [Candidatus Paceibacterota bacterium]